MKTQHTPGPWFIDDNHFIASALSLIADPQCNLRMDAKEVAANARLLAAAPQLLAACKIALGQLEGSKPLSGVHQSSLCADIQIIREAIAEAEIL